MENLRLDEGMNRIDIYICNGGRAELPEYFARVFPSTVVVIVEQKLKLPVANRKYKEPLIIIIMRMIIQTAVGSRRGNEINKHNQRDNM